MRGVASSLNPPSPCTSVLTESSRLKLITWLAFAQAVVWNLAARNDDDPRDGLSDDVRGRLLAFVGPPEWMRLSISNQAMLGGHRFHLHRLLSDTRPPHIFDCVVRGDYFGAWIHIQRNTFVAMRALHEKTTCPLITAALLKPPTNIIVTALLLRSRADVNQKEASGDTALHVAAKSSTAELVTVLLQSRANVNAVDLDGVQPLHYASQTGEDKTVACLIKAKATHLDAQVNHDIPSHGGATPLLLATERNRVAVVRMLLEAGAREVNLCKTNGINAMMVAASQDYMDILRMFIIVNEEDPGRPRSGPFVSPLFAACGNGHLRAAELLLEARASFDAPCQDGESALLVCAKEGHADVLQLLIDARARFHGVYQRHPNFTPLYFAASRGHAAAVATLLNARANYRERRSSSPMRSAAEHGHVEDIEILLSASTESGAPRALPRSAQAGISFPFDQLPIR